MVRNLRILLIIQPDPRHPKRVSGVPLPDLQFFKFRLITVYSKTNSYFPTKKKSYIFTDSYLRKMSSFVYDRVKENVIRSVTPVVTF